MQADPGLKIGKFVISNAKYTYYQQKNIIYMTNNSTKKTTQLIKPKVKTAVWQIFLDAKGTLYYVGYLEHEATYYIYKCVGKRATVIAKSIDELLRVDKKYIYYTVFDKKSIIKRYNIATGATEIVSVKTSNYMSDNKISKIKPLLISTGYIINLKTSKSFKAFDTTKQNTMISKDGNSMLCYNWYLDGAPVDIYNLASGEHFSIQLPQEILDLHTTFTPDDFIFTGTELQILYENYLYVIHASDGQLTQKVCLLDTFVHDPVNLTAASCFCSWAVDNGKWYLLVQKPSKYDTKTGSEEIIEVQPSLYSFNIQTHEFKLLWKAKSVNINGGSITIDIDSGYIWFFTYSNVNSFWMKLPLKSFK